MYQCSTCTCTYSLLSAPEIAITCTVCTVCKDQGNLIETSIYNMYSTCTTLQYMLCVMVIRNQQLISRCVN